MREWAGSKLGIVVAVYPEGNSIDVLMPKTGDKLANVQCMSHTGSSNTGIMDLPEIGLPVDDTRWNLKIVNSASAIRARHHSEHRRDAYLHGVSSAPAYSDDF